MIDRARLGPVDGTVAQLDGVRLHLLQVLRGNWVEVGRGTHAHRKRNCGNHRGNGLRLLVGILVKQGQDDEGQEGYDGENGTELRLEEELELVLLGRRIDVVRLLPELTRCNNANEVKHEKDAHPHDGVKEWQAPIQGARLHNAQGSQGLEDDGKNPQQNGKATTVARVSARLNAIDLNLGRNILGVGHYGLLRDLLATFGIDKNTLHLALLFFSHADTFPFRVDG